jgi:DNA mismatch repair protein MutL
MPDIVHLLPDSVANQIAAGEVILRPASAVKELMENAVDSGATEINLIVKDSGKTLIQVVDNGCGMSERDARMAFERHATSKIKTASDLFAIRTLGFRGEALASVAAVAQVEMRTRRHEDELGTLLEIEGSRVKNQAGCSCPAGTSIQVKNLFFNVPARRSFLKADPAELRHIIDEFFRVALVYNNIRFTFHHNQKPLYQVVASNRKQRIVGLFGSVFNERLVPLEHVTEAISVTGFIGKPEFARKTRGEQFFFVNGRFIKHPYLHHSIESAYRELIPEDSIPSYFIYIDTDPATIDINIHPTKTEINFLDNKVVYAVLRSAVRQSLGLHQVIAPIDFDVERSLDFTPPAPGQPIRNPFDKPQSDFNPFDYRGGNRTPANPQGGKGNAQEWERLFEPNDAGANNEPDQLFNSDDETNDNAESQYNVFQFQNRWIISSMKSGLVVIDQQRAHERVLYEYFMQQMSEHRYTSQQELFPCQVSFTASDAELLEDMLEDLKMLGYHLNKMGKNTFVVVGSPAGSEEADFQSLLEAILDRYKKNLDGLDSDKRVNLARSMASSLAAKPGQRLFQAEMLHLIGELFSCKAPELTPDGRKTFVIIPEAQLHQLFNR